MYRIEFSKQAAKAFRNFSPDIQRRLDPAIRSLAENPRPPGSLKLSAEESLWRIRAGDYRIIYQIHDQSLLVLVLRAGDRREIYR